MNITILLKKLLTANLELQYSNECLTYLNQHECFIHNNKTCFESVAQFISLYKLRLSLWESKGYNESKQWNDLFATLETDNGIQLCCINFYIGKFHFQIYFNLKTESMIKILKLELPEELNREKYVGKVNYVHLLPG